MAQVTAVVDVTKYPGVDWALCLDLTGNNERLAEDLLNMFVETLPQELAVLQTAYKQHNYEALKQQAHRMHGALCYCGIPTMKAAMLELEKACILALKNESDAHEKQYLSNAYAKAKNEIDGLLEYISV